MIKAREQTDPKSCLSKARQDEMVFVLLGRDAAAADAVRFWAARRVELGKNLPTDAQIVEALHCADVMDRTAKCARCREPFVASTVEFARSPNAVCATCFHDLTDDQNAEEMAAAAAADRSPPTTDLF